MRGSALLAALAILLAAPAAAQSAPVTREDSLNIGRKYVQWVYDSQVDLLWDKFTPEVQGALESRDGLRQRIDELILTFGSEIELIAEDVTTKDGNLVYTREVRFDARPEDAALWSITVAPDGILQGIAMRPKARGQQAGGEAAGD